MTESRDYRKYLEKCFDIIEEKNELRQTGINAQFREVNHTLDQINKHLEKQNVSIAELQQESNKREKVVNEFYEFKSRFLWVKKKWFIVILVLAIFVLVINVLYDIGAINVFFEKLFNKI